MTEPVEAALREAGEAARNASHLCGIYPGAEKCRDTMTWQPCRCRRQATAAIAAFHRAIAHHHRCSGLDAEDYEALAMRHEHWAAAVERAGRGE